MTEYNGYSNAMTDVFTSQFQAFDSLVSSLVYVYFCIYMKCIFLFCKDAINWSNVNVSDFYFK